MGSKSKASGSSASKEEKRESKQVRLLEEAKAKLECKVDMLATMVAMKDECLKASDERLLALKWELLANHRGDEEKLHALAQALRERCHGWGGEAPADGTRAVATLVVVREDAVEKRFRGSPELPCDAFADGLAEVLPEFRRDYLAAVAANFGQSVRVENFLSSCRDAYVDVLRKQSASASSRSGGRVGRAAHSALAANDGGRGRMLDAPGDDDSEPEAPLAQAPPPAAEAPPAEEAPAEAPAAAPAPDPSTAGLVLASPAGSSPEAKKKKKSMFGFFKK